jgi:hypothetical protein
MQAVPYACNGPLREREPPVLHGVHERSLCHRVGDWFRIRGTGSFGDWSQHAFKKTEDLEGSGWTSGPSWYLEIILELAYADDGFVATFQLIAFVLITEVYHRHLYAPFDHAQLSESLVACSYWHPLNMRCRCWLLYERGVLDFGDVDCRWCSHHWHLCR